MKNPVLAACLALSPASILWGRVSDADGMQEDRHREIVRLAGAFGVSPLPLAAFCEAASSDSSINAIRVCLSHIPEAIEAVKNNRVMQDAFDTLLFAAHSEVSARRDELARRWISAK